MLVIAVLNGIGSHTDVSKLSVKIYRNLIFLFSYLRFSVIIDIINDVLKLILGRIIQLTEVVCMLKIVKCAKCGHWQELDDELTCHGCDADFHQANSYYTASSREEEEKNRKKFDRLGENEFNDVMRILQERIDEYQFKTCPHCGRQVLKTEMECQSCGHKFNRIDTSIRDAQSRLGIIVSAACVILIVTITLLTYKSYKDKVADISNSTAEYTESLESE